MPAPEQAELLPKLGKLDLLALGEAHEGRELLTLGLVRLGGGEGADPALEPPVLGLERERPGIAVREGALERRRVVLGV